MFSPYGFLSGFGFRNMNMSSDAIDKKLENPDVKLEDILAEDELIQELKYQNQKLLDFLNKENVKKLVDYITKVPEEDEQLKGHKFPFVCSQMFNTEEMKLMNYFLMTNREIREEEINNAMKQKEKEVQIDTKSNDSNDVFQKNFDMDEFDRQEKEKEKQNMKLLVNDDNEDEEKEDKEDKEDEDNNNENNKQDNNENTGNNNTQNNPDVKPENENNKQETLQENANNQQPQSQNIANTGNEQKQEDIKQEESKPQPSTENPETKAEPEKVQEQTTEKAENIEQEKSEAQPEPEKQGEDKKGFLQVLAGAIKDSNQQPNVRYKDAHIDKADKQDEEKQEKQEEKQEENKQEEKLEENKQEKVKEEEEKTDTLKNDIDPKIADKIDLLDYLLEFLLPNEELNYVLCGYFHQLMQNLLNIRPLVVINYIYKERQDILERMVYHSYRKSIADTLAKILFFENHLNSSDMEKEEKNLLFDQEKMKKIRSDLLNKIFSEFKLTNPPEKTSSFIVLVNELMDSKQIFEEITTNPDIINKLIIENYLNTDLSNINNNNDSIRDMRINFGLLLDFICGLITEPKNNLENKVIRYPEYFTDTEDDLVQQHDKDTNKSTSKISHTPLSEAIFKVLENILVKNFCKKTQNIESEYKIKESYNESVVVPLGTFRIKIVEFVGALFPYFKNIPDEFDKILINSRFFEVGFEYLFDYEWNNLFQNALLNVFKKFLMDSSNHQVLAKYLFDTLGLIEIIKNHVEDGERLVDNSRKASEMFDKELSAAKDKIDEKMKKYGLQLEEENNEERKEDKEAKEDKEGKEDKAENKENKESKEEKKEEKTDNEQMQNQENKVNEDKKPDAEVKQENQEEPKVEGKTEEKEETKVETTPKAPEDNTETQPSANKDDLEKQNLATPEKQRLDQNEPLKGSLDIDQVNQYSNLKHSQSNAKLHSQKNKFVFNNTRNTIAHGYYPFLISLSYKINSIIGGNPLKLYNTYSREGSISFMTRSAPPEQGGGNVMNMIYGFGNEFLENKEEEKEKPDVNTFIVESMRKYHSEKWSTFFEDYIAEKVKVFEKKLCSEEPRNSNNQDSFGPGVIDNDDKDTNENEENNNEDNNEEDDIINIPRKGKAKDANFFSEKNEENNNDDWLGTESPKANDDNVNVDEFEFEKESSKKEGHKMLVDELEFTENQTYNDFNYWTNGQKNQYFSQIGEEAMKDLED